MNKYTLLSLVSDISGIPQAKICSKHRDKELVRARHLYYYFGRVYFGLKLTEMSILIGSHHSSAIHAVYKVGNLVEIDDEYYCPLFYKIRDNITAERELKMIVPYNINLIELFDTIGHYFPSVRVIAEPSDTELSNTPDK